MTRKRELKGGRIRTGARVGLSRWDDAEQRVTRVAITRNESMLAALVCILIVSQGQKYMHVLPRTLRAVENEHSNTRATGKRHIQLKFAANY